MKKNISFTSMILLNTILFLSLCLLSSCKSADGLKIAGDGTTDSDLSQKVKVTTLSLKVPLSEMEEDKYQIAIGGYSTVVLPLESNSQNCTARSELEEMFESDSGKLSDISLNSLCPYGYKITVNLFCKNIGSSSKVKCYSGDINISPSQLRSSSKLSLNVDLHKTVVSMDGPDNIPMVAEINNEMLTIELVGVFDVSDEEGKEVQNTKDSQKEATKTVTTTKQDINNFMNTSCLTSVLKHLKYSQKTCNSSPLRINSDFTLECNYYKDNPMLYPSVARFKSVSIDGKVYHPTSTKELTNVINGLDDNLTVNYSIINSLGLETGVQFKCSWIRKK